MNGTGSVSSGLLPEGMTRFQVSAVSHPGKVRKRNEDSFFYGFRQGEPSLCAAVADGIGGGCNGHIASSLTLQMLSRFWYNTSFPEQEELSGCECMMQECFRDINGRIHHINMLDPAGCYMGTTLACGVFFREKVLLFHAGDSRICRIRSGKMSYLTTEHNLIHDPPGNWLLSEEETKIHPGGRALTRSIGPYREVKTDSCICDLEKEDIFLLASDGLFLHVTPGEIGQMCQEHHSDRSLSASLCALTLERGARDNVSAIVIRVI